MKEHGLLFKPEMVLAEQSGRKTMTSRVITAHNSTVDGYGGKAIFNNLNFDDDAVADHSFRDQSGSYLHVAHKTGSRHRVRARVEKGDRFWIRERWRVKGWHEAEPILVEFADGQDLETCNGRTFEEDGRIEGWTETMWIQSGKDCEDAGYKVNDLGVYEFPDDKLPTRWRPSIHLPRCACRTILEVLDVFPYRIQDITEVESVAEGVQTEREYYGDETIDPERWYMYDGSCHAARNAKRSFQSLWDSINGKPRPDGVDISWAANPWVWGYKFRRVE